MGKILKRVLIVIFGVIGVAVLVLAVTFIAMCGISDNRNKNYWKYADPYGEIEKKYTALGDIEVSCDEFQAKDGASKKYFVWYPADIKDGTEKYPVVIMANGTGVKSSSYKEVFRHLASWGFIVAGNEDENCRTGASTAATLDFVLALNENSDGKFYGKIDTENVGVAGHSQGGVGAINAVTEQENGNKYKAVWAASATSRYHADELNKNGDGWTCHPDKINVPVMMVAGTGMMDAGNMDRYTASLGKNEAQGICPKWWLDECYAAIPANVTKVVAREKDKDHGDMLRYADGYMTAWFMYFLKGESSANFFGGENAELLSNEHWQDIRVNSI